MITYKIIENESAILNLRVVLIENIANNEFAFDKFENDLLQKEKPFYIQVFLSAKEIDKIHFLEQKGYSFAEFRLKCQFRLADFEGAGNFYPYSLVQITSEEMLKSIINISINQSYDDRFYNDPELIKLIKLDRHQKLLRMSFENKNEVLLALINEQNNNILGYKSFIIIDKHHVAFSLTGIQKNKFKISNYFEILNYLVFDYLIKHEFHFCDVVISGLNFEEINFYLKTINFNLIDTSVILRKLIYNNIKNV